MNNPDLEPIERHGEEPLFKSFRKKSDELEFMLSKVRDFHESEAESMAVIVRTQAEADELYELLNPIGGVSLLNSRSRFFAGGVVITTAQLAKGLEFDEVLIPFCTKANHCQVIDRYMLYIAVTRAMHSLTVTYCGNICEFLDAVVDDAAPSLQK